MYNDGVLDLFVLGVVLYVLSFCVLFPAAVYATGPMAVVFALAFLVFLGLATYAISASARLNKRD